MKNKDESVPLSGSKLERSMKPISSTCSVIVSFGSTLLVIFSCLAFSFFFHRALSGFSRQVNAFVKIGDFASIVLQVIVIALCVGFILYLLLVYLSSVKYIRAVPCCGSPIILFLTSVSSQGFLVGWVLLLCFVSSITLVYFIFIGSIYSFCALLDQQCFDFTVLIPAIVSKISNQKVDMTFCAEKKELLCSAANNQIWTFILAFVFCMITFVGALTMQNCVVFGLGKKQQQPPACEDKYEMKELS